MPRVFAYARVSTVAQLTENQREQIAQAGYRIPANRFVEEKVSGSVHAMQRPGFRKLLDMMEGPDKEEGTPGDTLIVTKLDRIGRDSIDVQQTVELFTERGIRLIVLQLGNLDLTSSSGALMVKVLAAVADFERDLIIERTQAGQARARAEGKHMGRPASTSEAQRAAIRAAFKGPKPVTVTEIAKRYSVSRATIIGIRDTTAPAAVS